MIETVSDADSSASLPPALTPEACDQLLRARDHAVSLLALAAVVALSPTPSLGPTARQTVQLLGGNTRLRADRSRAAVATLDGALYPAGALWLLELLEALTSSGWLEEQPRGRLFATTLAHAALERQAPAPEAVLPRPALLGVEPESEEVLARVRLELATREGCSAYCVFPNRTLAELVARQPRDLGELAAVPGFGESRIRRFGREVIAALSGLERHEARPAGDQDHPADTPATPDGSCDSLPRERGRLPSIE